MNSSASLAVRPDGVGVLTLDQPGSRVNVLTRELWQDLDAALDEAAKQSPKGLVIASAKPGVFIAGADLKLLADATGPNDPAVRAFIDQGLRVLEKLESLPFPTCAAIDGAALGGGLEVALACDMRVAGNHPKVQLGLPEVKLDLIPGWGGTQRLPRIAGGSVSSSCGMETAAELLTTGRNCGFEEAGRIDLATAGFGPEWLIHAAINKVAKSRWVVHRHRRALKLQPIADRVSQSFVTPPALTGAAAEAVRVMIEGASLPLYDAIKLETEAFMNLAGSPESKRLIAEFFASRKK